MLGSSAIDGSSYVMVSAAKCIIACVFGKGPSYGERLWYQLISGIASMMIVSRSYFAVSSLV